MPKSFAVSASDQALGFIQSNATRLSLCAGAPEGAADAITEIGNGGSMLADLQITPTSVATFAVTTSPTGGRVLVVGGQSEIIGHEAGTADHLAVVDTAGGEILVLTELTEPQPVLPGAIISTRPFTVALGNP